MQKHTEIKPRPEPTLILRTAHISVQHKAQPQYSTEYSTLPS